jgi:structural maintenance of chromosome 3 (chondroitin sulfate proteoglycan 6)
MTGGFYDYKRSKLKSLSIVRESTKMAVLKEKEIEMCKSSLQNILSIVYAVQMRWMFL